MKKYISQTNITPTKDSKISYFSKKYRKYQEKIPLVENLSSGHIIKINNTSYKDKSGIDTKMNIPLIYCLDYYIFTKEYYLLRRIRKYTAYDLFQSPRKKDLYPLMTRQPSDKVIQR